MPRPGRTAAICAGAVCLLSGAPPHAVAQSGELTLERRGPPALTVEAGGQLTIVYRVTNRANRPRVAEGVLVLPATWRLVIPGSADTLAAHASTLTLLRVAIPADAQAGTTVLRYALTAGPRGTSAAADSVLVTIPLRRLVTAAPWDAPRTVVAGAPYVTRFAVRNGGSAPETVRLTLTASDGYAVRVDSGSALLRLAPSEQRIVEATVTTDASVTHPLDHRVQLDALIVGDSAAFVSAVSRVEIVTRRAASAPRFRVVPAELLLRGGDAMHGVAGELHGAGPLTAGGDTRLEFLARSPSRAASFFGQQDEYWLNLLSTRYTLRIGDQGYRVSRVNETGHPAFGGAGDLTLGSVRLGAFASRDRRSYDYTQERQRGGNVDFTLSGRAQLGAGYLARTGVNAGEIWSGRGRVALLPGTALSGEYGRGRTPAAGGNAYVATLSANRPRVSLQARRESADLDFPAYWRGTSYTDAALTLQPVKNLELIGNANEYVTQARQAAFASSASYQRGVEGGFAYGGGLLGATYRHGQLSGGTSGPLAGRLVTLDRGGNSVRFFAGVPVGTGSLHAEVEHGFAVTTDAPDLRIPFRQLALRGSLNSAPLSLSASIQRITGPSPFSYGTPDQTTASVDAGIRVAPSTQLTIGVNGTRYGTTPARTFSSVNIGLGQRLPSGQRVTWLGRSYATRADGSALANRQSMQQVEYLMPVGVPVGLSRESGVIEARLVDESTGRPVPGVLMRVADEARVTDERGRAQFTRLTAGTYYLTVDREKLGRGRIVTPGSPVRVSIRTGETRAIDLRVASGASIHGAARVFRYQPTRLGAPDTLVDAGPLANVALVLSNRGDTVRTLADAEGRFSVPELHAGHWVVDVVVMDRLARHTMDPERMELDLTPGEARTLAIRAMPTRAAVRFVDEADLTPQVVRSAPRSWAAPRGVPRRR